MSLQPISVSVLIVGAGPVGVTAAMDLAYRGVKSLVLETRVDLPPSPRCNTTNARSMEIFRRLGCAAAIRAAGLPEDHSTDVVYMTSMNAEEIVRYERPTPKDWASGSARGVGSDWPTPEPQHFISQIFLEPALREHAVTSYGIEVKRGFEFVSMTQDSDGVISQVRNAETGEIRSIRSRYLIGADGSSSTVRSQIGARLIGIPKLGHACSLLVRSARLSELYKEHPGWMYRFLGGVVAVAIDGHDLWLIHTYPKPDQDPQTFNPEPAIFEAIGEAFEYEVVDLTRWSPRAMVCNKFRERNVFLAGDAAHIWIPLGGFGMNAGIGDAEGISWRLAGVLQGWLDPKILDTYESERMPLGERVAMQAVRWAGDMRSLLQSEPGRRAELNKSGADRLALGERIRDVNLSEFESCGMQLGWCYEDSPIICTDTAPAPRFALEQYVESSSPGARAPHVWREGTSDRRCLFDDFGTGFTLLRIGSNPSQGASLIAEAERREVPLAVVDVTEEEAVRKYQDYGLVLVRPDQHIAWRGSEDPTDSKAVLDRVTGRSIHERPIGVLRPQWLTAEIGLPLAVRFKRGNLIVAELQSNRLVSYDPATNEQSPIAAGRRVGGFGHLLDGRLIASSPNEARLVVVTDDGVETYADLGFSALGEIGELVVDTHGRIYVADSSAISTRVLCVDTDGSVKLVLDGLKLSGGMAISPDGQVFFIYEQGIGISQARIEPDGGLRAPRKYLDFEFEDSLIGSAGVSASRDGSLWVCCPGLREVHGYDVAGRLRHRVPTHEAVPLTCALSLDGGTLFLAGTDGTNRGWLATVRLSTDSSFEAATTGLAVRRAA